MKAELVQTANEKMRQKVCLILIDRDLRLLREKPKAWDDIKVGKFMFINGQHSITAFKSSKSLVVETSAGLGCQGGTLTLYGAWTLLSPQTSPNSTSQQITWSMLSRRGGGS